MKTSFTLLSRMEITMAMINKISNSDTTGVYGTSSSRGSSEDFSTYLGESKSLDKIFDEAADKYNVPVELLKSVGKAESNFNPDAVSRCGAQGIMQLMPSTAKGLGVKDSFDPEQNIMGGAKYLSGLLDKYDGNTKLTLAAYNAGSGNVTKYGGVPPFEETQNYVKKVIGFMRQGGSDNSGNSADSSISGSLNDNNETGDSTEKYLHVPPVTVPTQISDNYAYLINGNSSGNSATDLDSLFSYDDYMKFLDIFLKEQNEQGTNEDNKNYGTQDISYNAAVLNLLTAQKDV